jgi:hypothetical protein
MPSMSLVSLLPQPRRRPIRITRLGCRNLLRTFGKLQNKTLTFDAFDIPVIVQNLPPIRGRQRQRPIEFDWMVGPSLHLHLLLKASFVWHFQHLGERGRRQNMAELSHYIKLRIKLQSNHIQSQERIIPPYYSQLFS